MSFNMAKIARTIGVPVEAVAGHAHDYAASHGQVETYGTQLLPATGLTRDAAHYVVDALTRDPAVWEKLTADEYRSAGM